MPKLKPLVVDGVIFTPQYVEGLREPLVAVRDRLIQEGHLSFAASMCEIHAVLKFYEENVE